MMVSEDQLPDPVTSEQVVLFYVPSLAYIYIMQITIILPGPLPIR